MRQGKGVAHLGSQIMSDTSCKRMKWYMLFNMRNWFMSADCLLDGLVKINFWFSVFMTTVTSNMYEKNLYDYLPVFFG